ncbi:MAG TPA: MBL fold metallo-hydrolase [Acidimicrobiales bacterium]|nr:MBL fold metallo-hydrolase [Acidimicrobiales bacterium]
MGLTLTVLGCDGSYAGPDGACSGYLVSSGATHLWVDCGPGTLANLQRHLDLHSLTAIVVSHSHPDHWADLPVAYNALGYYFDRRAVPVYGTTDTGERLRVAKGGSIDEVFDWHTITDGSSFEVGDVMVSCAVTDHPVETLALRFTNGEKSIGYTADTGSAWSVSALGSDLDLLLCEATFPEDRAGEFPHLTASEAGAAARDAGVARLVLTHLLPGSNHDVARDNAARAFGRDVEIATTHARYEL